MLNKQDFLTNPVVEIRLASLTLWRSGQFRRRRNKLAKPCRLRYGTKQSNFHYGAKARSCINSLIRTLRSIDKVTQLTLILGVLIIGISATRDLHEKISEIATGPAYTRYASYVAQDEGFVTEEFNYEHILVNSSAFRASLAPPQYRQILLRRIWVPITAYSSTPDQTDSTPFITASGSRVRDGVVAANFLPIGTKVKIPTIYGEKVFVVEDRMNSRYGFKLDIWMPTRAQALQFGLRTLPIEVIKEI